MNEYFIDGIPVTKTEQDAYAGMSGLAKKTFELKLRDRVGVKLEPGDAMFHEQFAKTKTAEPTVADSVAATLAQRGSRYGDFTDHARLCQGLMDVMKSFNPGDPTCEYHPGSYPWARLDNVKRQALTVIVDKIARILSGDPNYDDNWHDIQGYAKLVEDRLPKPGSTN